jgi:hypothetical protein
MSKIRENRIRDAKQQFTEWHQDVSNIIYNNLGYMYCDNCRFDSEISKEESEQNYGYWPCEICHRKYNGWGISRAECNKLARIIGEINELYR